jgi:hypothetical protein
MRRGADALKQLGPACLGVGLLHLDPHVSGDALGALDVSAQVAGERLSSLEIGVGRHDQESLSVEPTQAIGVAKARTQDRRELAWRSSVGRQRHPEKAHRLAALLGGLERRLDGSDGRACTCPPPAH